MKGIQCFLIEGLHSFSRGDNKKNANCIIHIHMPMSNTLTKFKNLLLQNHWANFNQTWHKASLGEGDSSLFK